MDNSNVNWNSHLFPLLISLNKNIVFFGLFSERLNVHVSRWPLYNNVKNRVFSFSSYQTNKRMTLEGSHYKYKWLQLSFLSNYIDKLLQ